MRLQLLRIFRYLALTLAVFISGGYGQELWDTVNLRSAQVAGLHLYGISVYSGYSTFSSPVTNQSLPPGLVGGSDTSYGAQWSLGWFRHSGKTTAFINYAGSYGGQIRFSNLNSFGHNLSLSVSRQIRTKWSLNASGSADYRTLTEYLFQPSTLSVLAGVPANASDLAAAFSVGNFSNSQTATMLSTMPETAAAFSPLRNLLLADRILSYAFQSSANYAYSSRLNFSFSSISAGGQRAFDNSPVQTVPRTLGVTAGVSFATSYALSPRTNVGVNVSEHYTANQGQGSYSTTAGASFGRMMGLHWFLSMNGGMTYSRFTGNAAGTPPRRQAIGGGVLGYRLYAQTFVASYNRSSFDAVGIPGALNSNATGAWNWHRRGSNLSLNASGGQTQVTNAAFTSFTVWRGSAGFSRVLTRQFSMSWDYVYFYSTGTYLDIRTNRAAHSVRVTLRWHPMGISQQDDVQRLPGIERQ
jgi:hypothetical protein